MSEILRSLHEGTAVVCGRPENHLVMQSCPNLKSRDAAMEVQEQISSLRKEPPASVMTPVSWANAPVTGDDPNFSLPHGISTPLAAEV